MGYQDQLVARVMAFVDEQDAPVDYSDIAEHLDADLESVVAACNLLMERGEIEWDVQGPAETPPRQ